MLKVSAIYAITDKLPLSEDFNLKSQLRRAAVSVVSNIAEGSARASGAERKRFYEISRSSCTEIDAQIEVCIMLNYISREDTLSFQDNMMEVFKMLSTMSKKYIYS